MTLRRTILIILLGVSVFGCAGPPRVRVQQPPEPAPQPRLSIDEKLIEERIRFTEGVLARKEISEGDRDTARALLNVYRQLKESTGLRLTDPDYQRLIQSLFKVVSLMEETYYGEKKTGELDKDRLSRLAAKRKAVIDRYLKEDYSGVIRGVGEIRKDFGPEAITPDVGLLLALSLGKEGDLKGAIQTGERIYADLNDLPDSLELGAKTAEWQLDLGNREKALQTYERLTEKERQRAALLQNLGRRIGAMEKKVETAERPTPEPEGAAPQETAQSEEPLSTEDLLKEVHSLVDQKAFSKARFLILRERIRRGEGPESDLLDKELEQIDRQEAALQSPPQAGDDALKETREKARQMIQEEDYSGAIAALRSAEGSQALDPESRALKDRAEEKLINKERNRAAELFLEAKKAQDPAKKRELLNSSYAILKGLIDAYPSSPMNQKLRSHLAVVQKELDKLK